MEDVSSSPSEPLPCPEVVAQFGVADCTLLGRLDAGGPPFAVLMTSDRQTLVAVDAVDGRAVLRLRSVLGNGDLIETVERGRLPATQPDQLLPTALVLHHAAPGRWVRAHTYWDARETLARHANFVAVRARKAKSTPETLDTMAEALLIWEAAERHDAMVERHGERIAANTPTLVLAGAILASMLIGLGLVVSGAPWPLLGAVVIAVLLIGTAALAGNRLTRWLFGVRRLRPRFTVT